MENDAITCDYYNNLLFLAKNFEHRSVLSSLANVTQKVKAKSIWKNPSKSHITSVDQEILKENVQGDCKEPEWGEFAKMNRRAAIDMVSDVKKVT